MLPWVVVAGMAFYLYYKSKKAESLSMQAPPLQDDTLYGSAGVPYEPATDVTDKGEPIDERGGILGGVTGRKPRVTDSGVSGAKLMDLPPDAYPGTRGPASLWSRPLTNAPTAGRLAHLSGVFSEGDRRHVDEIQKGVSDRELSPETNTWQREGRLQRVSGDIGAESAREINKVEPKFSPLTVINGYLDTTQEYLKGDNPSTALLWQSAGDLEEGGEPLAASPTERVVEGRVARSYSGGIQSVEPVIASRTVMESKF